MSKSILDKFGDAIGILKGTKRAEDISPDPKQDVTDTPIVDSTEEPDDQKTVEETDIPDTTDTPQNTPPPPDASIDEDEKEKEEEEDVKETEDTDSETVEDDIATDDTVAEPVVAESEKDFNAPAIRVKTAEIIGSDSFIVGMSIQGRSHIASDSGCQDFHTFATLGEGWHLAIVSDGAGSAREAERGSKANCELAVKMVTQLVKERKWVEKQYLPTDKEWYIEIRNIFEMIQTLIIRKVSTTASDSEEKPLEPRDFNATIILMLVTPKGMLTAHIGDGRMGYLSANGEWHAAMTPHKGEEANETVFIPNNWNKQPVVPAFTMSGAFLPDTKVIEECPKAIVLMSDGCENFTWRCTAHDKEQNKYYDPNLPFPGFLNPLVDEMKEEQEPAKKVDRLIEIINVGTPEALREQDDRTILLGVFE